MSCRVGLVSRRSEIVGEVGGLVAEIGGEVVLLEPGRRSQHPIDGPGSPVPDGEPFDVLLIDWLAASSDEVSAQAAVPAQERVVVCRESEQAQAAERARRLGAAHVVALPGGRAWLQGRTHRPAGGRPLVGVVGAVGGAGATTVAIALAAARSALLVDLDPDGAGVHLPLGLDDAPGIRWERLPADARGPLDPESLLGAVPRVGELPVLCGAVPEPGQGPVASVLATARIQSCGAVLDLGRRDRHAGLGAEDWMVLVVPSTVAGVLAAQRARERIRARLVVAIRESGWVPVPDVVAELGAPPCVRVPRLRRAPELAECGQLLAGATGRKLLQVGDQLAELTA